MVVCSAFMMAHGGELAVLVSLPWVRVTFCLPSAKCDVRTETWFLNSFFSQQFNSSIYSNNQYEKS